MRKPSLITCVSCGRPRRTQEGRFVDGSWPSDQPILARTRSRTRFWVCGWNCYQKLYEIAVEKRL